MTIVHAASLALAAVLALGAGRVEAVSHPLHTCAAAKQKAAGKYCTAALKAWATWDLRQDSARRDAAIANAANMLAFSWGRAEARSAQKGFDCAETTVTFSALTNEVDAAIDDIVADVNSGLNLADDDHARCGQKLLAAAGTKCGKYLAAQSRHVKFPSRDTDRAKLTSLKLGASGRFALSWASAVAGNCPTNADQAAVEAQVDAISANAVHDTQNSPAVPEAQFATYTPGPVEYQGRTFTPICMNDSPYAYFAKRGTVNNLLIYYQGGGACWEQLTCGLPVCDTNVNVNGFDNPNNQSTGFADIDNPANPFRDWNIVFVSYCSCDIHFGDAAQDYSPSLHVEHRGYHNSRVVEKWATEHFLAPDRIFVTGSSAGAYGAWFNAPLHHFVWPSTHFDVLADAGNGVITQDFLETYFPNWNFEANIPDTIPGVQESLDNGTGIPGYTEAVADFFPSTRWAHYTTAYDGGLGGQTGFYNIMLNNNNVIAAATWWEGSCAFNSVMRQQAFDTAAAIPNNYRYYIGTGSRHTVWGSNRVYDSTVGGVPTVVDWVNGMLGGTPAWTNVEASNFGLLLDTHSDPDVRPNPLEPPFEQQGPDVVVNCGP
jgi:hypothetical protein